MGMSLQNAPNSMAGFDWLDAQIANCRLGTHLKGGHSAGYSESDILQYHNCVFE